MREERKYKYIAMSDEGEGSWTSEENWCAREKRPSECSEPVNGRKGHVRMASVNQWLRRERERVRKKREQTIWLDEFFFHRVLAVRLAPFVNTPRLFCHQRFILLYLLRAHRIRSIKLAKSEITESYIEHIDTRTTTPTQRDRLTVD